MPRNWRGHVAALYSEGIPTVKQTKYRPDQSDRDQLKTARFHNVKITKAADGTYSWSHDKVDYSNGWLTQYHAARNALLDIELKFWEFKHASAPFKNASFKKSNAMNDHDAMLAIQELLDGVAWDADTLESIARILVNSGYRVRDLNDIDMDDLLDE